MIIAITGPILAGKETAAKYISGKGFKWHSLSKKIKDIAGRRNISPNRSSLKKLGNDLILEGKGSSILAKEILADIKSQNDKNIVIEGIRDRQTINDLQKSTDKFILIGIDADQKLRFERCKKRDRPFDPKTFDDFIDLDDSENYDQNIGQQIYSCMDQADFTIINDSSLVSFYKKIDEVLRKFD